MMETYMLNCFPRAYKAAATTSHLVVLAKPGPEPEAAVILTHFDKCVALGLVFQQVGEGQYECLLGEAQCQHHDIVKVRVHLLTASLFKSTSDVVHCISRVGEDKNILLRHRMPLPLTRQATGKGHGSLCGPRKLDDNQLANLCW
jgi:hypothetical protein